MVVRHDSDGAGRLFGWLTALASPRWTVLFFLLTAAASLATAYQLAKPTVMMVAPFALLLVNLGAAIIVHRRFRADLPLLLFHLALLALVALIAAARLTYMTGTVALTSGTAFDGQFITDERGPLHWGQPQELRFANDGFVEDQSARYRLHAIYNRVRWRDDAGQWHPAEIGDDSPLLLKGYKIYPSSHRGFAPLLRWQGAGGVDEFGSVQLNDQADGSVWPAIKFTLPDGSDAWVMLDSKTPGEPTTKTRVDLGSAELPHSLVLRVGDVRHVMRPGDQIDLPGGKLSYVQLDSWMGYAISSDPTRPWIFATVLIGIASMIWFYWRRLFAPDATGRAPP